MAGSMNIDQEDVPYESSQSPTGDDLKRTVHEEKGWPLRRLRVSIMFPSLDLEGYNQ